MEYHLGASRGAHCLFSGVTALWDVLHTPEKTRIVHLLVERVVSEGDEGDAQVVFHANAR